MRQLFLLLACCLCLPGIAAAHTPGDPNFLQPDFQADWKTLRTPHFNIHHEARQQAYARQLATLAERVHTRLAPWLRWQPAEATEVILLDSADYSNGAATVLPYNRFYLFLPTPVEGEIMDHNPWLEYVFTHEYVHILQLDMAHGGPARLRELFGRPIDLLTAAIFPQVFAPSWVTEGLAVYGESNNPHGYGRLGNAWYEAWMRMEVERGLRSLEEVSFEGYSGSRWPFGLNYLYGAYFYRFMLERYGSVATDYFVQSYSYNLIPWRMEQRFRMVFDKAPKQVWQEFQDYLRQRFQPQLQSLTADENNTHLLYDRPYHNRWLTPGTAGELYFYHDDGTTEARVLRLDSDGSVSPLLETSGVQHLDWHPTAGLLLSRHEVCDNIKLYADLYSWDNASRKLRRLTTCGRYPRASWRPDGQAIAAVQQDGALTRLMLLARDGRQLEELASLPLGDTLGHIAWSPDGSRLVAAVKRQRWGWNLELFDLAQRRWQVLTRNTDLEIRPRFMADGRAVYFLSDHGGVWNLRRLALDGGTVTTLSRSRSGIAEAVAMPDGSFRIAEHGTSGMLLKSLTPASTAEADYPAVDETMQAVGAIVNTPDYQPAPYTAQDYLPWDSLSPRSWLPLLYSGADGADSAGVLLYGTDALNFHQWQAMPLYYWNEQYLGGAVSYTLYNKLTLAVERQLYYSGAPTALFRALADDTRYRLLLQHSFNSKEHSLTVAAGVVHEALQRTYVNLGDFRLQVKDTLGGMSLRYDDTEFYTRSITPENGRRIRLQMENHGLLGQNGPYTGRAWRADWQEHLSLGGNHVLYLRALRATGDIGIRPYNLGGELDPFILPGDTDELGRRSFPLRGYPGGSLNGNQALLVTAEWRIPLGLIYDGLFVPPLGIGRHALTLFTDHGSAWNDPTPAAFRTGIGAEWNVETLIGYDMLHLGVKLGYAAGLGQDGAQRLYLQFGSTF